MWGMSLVSEFEVFFGLFNWRFLRDGSLERGVSDIVKFRGG